MTCSIHSKSMKFEKKLPIYLETGNSNEEYQDFKLDSRLNLKKSILNFIISVQINML